MIRSIMQPRWLPALLLFICSSCSSEVVEQYRIDYDSSLLEAYPDTPAPPGSIEAAVSSPYNSDATNGADAAKLKEITERAYARARELSAYGNNLNKPAPKPAGFNKAVQETRKPPYPATYYPSRIYPYYRPYILPTYWPYGPYRGQVGFGSGIGIWLHH